MIFQFDQKYQKILITKCTRLSLEATPTLLYVLSWIHIANGFSLATTVLLW